MKKFLPIYILTLLFSASCSLPTAGIGSVSGTVVSAETGIPMQDVVVMYGDSAVYTDENGAYFYEGIPDGKQALTFIKDGYAKVVNFVEVSNKAEAQCDAQLHLEMVGWAVGANDSDYGTILYSEDGGVSWVRQGTPAQISNVDLTGVCVVDTKTCWAVGQYDSDRNSFTIIRTEDAGKTWTAQGKSISGLPVCDFAAIVSKDGKSAWAVADTTGYIVSTNNKGSSWKVANKSEFMKYYTSISTPDGIHLWACGKGVDGNVTVEYSPDGGTAWEAFTLYGYSGSQVPTSIYAVDTLNLYMAGTGGMGILHSKDGGQTWTSTFFTDYSDIYSIDALDTQNLWASGAEGSLFSTSDTFSTHVKSQPLNDFSTGIAVYVDFLRDGNKGVAAIVSASGETGALVYTVDGGASWQQSNIPFNFAIKSVDFIGGSK